MLTTVRSRADLFFRIPGNSFFMLGLFNLSNKVINFSDTFNTIQSPKRQSHSIKRLNHLKDYIRMTFLKIQQESPSDFSNGSKYKSDNRYCHSLMILR